MDAHSTDVLQAPVLLGDDILNTTAAFFACGINPEKNIFSSLWCLTIRNQVGAWSGCHGYNTCIRQRQSMLTRSARAQWAHWHLSFRLHSVIQAHTPAGGAVEVGNYSGSHTKFEKVLGNSFQPPIYFNFSEVSKIPHDPSAKIFVSTK